jgi:hypothetical protein
MEPIRSCADATGAAYQSLCHDRRARNSATSGNESPPAATLNPAYAALHAAAR